MKFALTTAILAATLGVLPAHAQFGSGIVYDPTQSAHAIEQIQQGQQIFTNSVRLADNAIATYNLAHEMSLAPQSLYQPFLSPSTYWMALNRGGQHLRQFAASGRIPSTPASARASVPASLAFQRTGQINGYGNLSTLGQQQIAAQGATVDLNDSVTTSNMQTLGTIRANSRTTPGGHQRTDQRLAVLRPSAAYGNGNPAADQQSVDPADSGTAGSQSDRARLPPCSRSLGKRCNRTI